MFRASFSFYVGLSLCCFLCFNCTKIDNTSIGQDLLPAVDNVNTFDTSVSVIANNYDSSLFDCFTIYPQNEHLLGYISNNPLFGTTQSTIYTELKPPAFPFNFPTGGTIDSVVLVLSYTSSFGDTTVPQKVNVYEVSGTFKPDSSSCKSYDHNPTPLGSTTYVPQELNDSVKGFREQSSNQLRIRLSDNFGQLLLAHDATAPFASDTTFRDFLKGFAIVPDISAGGNALSYFSLVDTNTKLSVYYKTSLTDTAVTTFRLNYLSASANYLVRNHNGAEVANHQAKPALGDEEIYIQTTPGTQAQIKIPDLGTISNRIIHRAVLTMDEIYDNSPLSNIFSTPYILYLDLHDSTFDKGYKPIPCDFSTLSGSPDITSFGGFRTIVKDPFGHSISRYTFNISRYIQKILTNKRTNSTLRLRAPDDIINTGSGYYDDCGQSVIPFIYPINLPAFGQVRLGGGNNTNYRMKVHIVYSNI